MKIFWSVLSAHECSVCSSRVNDRGEWVLENIWEGGKKVLKKKIVFGGKLKNIMQGGKRKK